MQHIAKRSIPLAGFESLLRLPGIAFYALHPEIPQAERDWLGAARLLTILNGQLADFAPRRWWPRWTW
jgi:hypothetical protein